MGEAKRRGTRKERKTTPRRITPKSPPKLPALNLDFDNIELPLTFWQDEYGYQHLVNPAREIKRR